MKKLWTWQGKFFGYLSGNHIWTFKGINVGILKSNYIFDRNGNYLGEIRGENRLITNTSRKSMRGPSFTPRSNKVGMLPHVNFVGNVMLSGYEDFPSPDKF